MYMYVRLMLYRIASYTEENYNTYYIYVTVHAKASLVRTKIEIHFLTQLLIVATCTACLPWPNSIGLLF